MIFSKSFIYELSRSFFSFNLSLYIYNATLTVFITLRSVAGRSSHAPNTLSDDTLISLFPAHLLYNFFFFLVLCVSSKIEPPHIAHDILFRIHTPTHTRTLQCVLSHNVAHRAHLIPFRHGMRPIPRIALAQLSDTESA